MFNHNNPRVLVVFGLIAESVLHRFSWSKIINDTSRVPPKFHPEHTFSIRSFSSRTWMSVHRCKCRHPQNSSKMFPVRGLECRSISGQPVLIPNHQCSIQNQSYCDSISNEMQIRGMNGWQGRRWKRGGRADWFKEEDEEKETGGG